MRMKIIERIKELQPDNWPEPKHKVSHALTILTWEFEGSGGVIQTWFSIDNDIDYGGSADYIAGQYADRLIDEAISRYNERFPDGQ